MKDARGGNLELFRVLGWCEVHQLGGTSYDVRVVGGAVLGVEGDGEELDPAVRHLRLVDREHLQSRHVGSFTSPFLD